MAHRRVARRGVFVALLAATAILVAGCSGSGFNYVKSSDYNTYFKVPDRWKLYDTGPVLEQVIGLTPDEADAQADAQWLSAFDANPSPRLSHIFSAKNHPWGLARVAEIAPEEADTVSLSSLRNLFFTIDGTETEDPAEVITYEPVNLDGGFHGSHLVANVKTKSGAVFTINQIAVLDQATSKVYAIVAACISTCYEKNKSKIEQVVDSWTVRDS